MRQFLRTTIVGGAVFLLPLVLILVLLGYAVGAAADVMQPILGAIGIDPRENIEGIGFVTLISVAALIAICFVAGFVGRTTIGAALTGWLERSVLGRLPQYQMMKSMAAAFAHLENTKGLSPVLAEIDGGWRLGYQIDSVSEGWLTVFLPQSPTPMAGRLIYLPAARVRPLAISFMDATDLVQRIGLGSAAALRGADFSLPVR